MPGRGEAGGTDAPGPCCRESSAWRVITPLTLLLVHGLSQVPQNWSLLYRSAHMRSVVSASAMTSCLGLCASL